ncbi:MAG: FHA domain-containing protein [Polyangiaceae bacterium]|nr:FHA domain-containing protein [Polyangiaceae bacterium]
MRGVMGAFHRGGDDTRFELSAVTRVGRDPQNELLLDAGSISQFHAVIRWSSPGEWELRDLGSINGTRVDGVLVPSAERRILREGECVEFGHGTEPFIVADVSRPLPEARDILSGERIFGSPHMLTLGGPEGTIIDVLEEQRGSWVLEAGDMVTAIRSGQVIAVGNRHYRLSLPLPAPETEETRVTTERVLPVDPLGDARLAFFVSSDHESVTMRIDWADRRWESQKAYNRALLALAQVRLRDQEVARLLPQEQGWIYGDELCTLADYDGVGRLNVEIHRARTELAKNGVPNGPAIVQRRRGTGQLRIGTNRIRIVDGAPRQ